MPHRLRTVSFVAALLTTSFTQRVVLVPLNAGLQRGWAEATIRTNTAALEKKGEIQAFQTGKEHGGSFTDSLTVLGFPKTVANKLGQGKCK